MDHGLKYKTYICKTLRKNNKWKSLGLRTRQRAPTLDTKSSVHRNKHRDIRFNQNEKASALWKTPFRGWKESWDWRKKKKQTTHITKDHCLEYIKPQNLTVKNHTIQLENRQKIGTDISSLQIFRW